MEGFTCVRCSGQFLQSAVKECGFYYDTSVGKVIVNCCPFCGISKCGKFTDYYLNRDHEKRKADIAWEKRQYTLTS